MGGAVGSTESLAARGALGVGGHRATNPAGGGGGGGGASGFASVVRNTSVTVDVAAAGRVAAVATSTVPRQFRGSVNHKTRIGYGKAILSVSSAAPINSQ
jgi:hypothetical protein